MHRGDEDLDDDAWENCETFAYFGSAMHMSSVLGVGLAHVLIPVNVRKDGH